MKSKQVAAARCSARDDEVRATRLRRFARHWLTQLGSTFVAAGCLGVVRMSVVR
jgi:hypothetical protein